MTDYVGSYYLFIANAVAIMLYFIIVKFSEKSRLISTTECGEWLAGDCGQIVKRVFRV